MERPDFRSCTRQQLAIQVPFAVTDNDFQDPWTTPIWLDGHIVVPKQIVMYRKIVDRKNWIVLFDSESIDTVLVMKSNPRVFPHLLLGSNERPCPHPSHGFHNNLKFLVECPFEALDFVSPNFPFVCLDYPALIPPTIVQAHFVFDSLNTWEMYWNHLLSRSFDARASTGLNLA